MSLEQYRVIADVVDECKTGLELKEGQTVEVIEKLETGTLVGLERKFKHNLPFC